MTHTERDKLGGIWRGSAKRSLEAEKKGKWLFLSLQKRGERGLIDSRRHHKAVAGLADIRH